MLKHELRYVSLSASIIIGIFIYCGFYAIPSADDYFYANIVDQYGFFKAQVVHYVEWSGRYAATFLITLFSLTDYKYYWLVPLTCISALLLSLYFFLWTVFHKRTDHKKLFQFSLAFVALFLSITTAGLGHGVRVVNEGFYWFSGALTYTMSLSLYLIQIANLVWMQRKKIIFLNYLCSLFLMVLIIGLNETAMFLVLLTVVPFLLFQRKQFGVITIVGYLLIMGICCSFVVFAPGNGVRMGTSDGGNILSALGICFEKIVQIFFYYLFNPFVWGFILIFNSLIIELTQIVFQYINKKILYICGAILVFLLYLPVAYSLNAGAPDRLIAFIGFFALLMSLLYASSLLPWIFSKLGKGRKLIVLVALVAMAGGYYCVEPLRIAITTTIAGPRFYQLHNKRKHSITREKKSGERTVLVDFIERNPLLLFEDLLPDNRNEEYARFHGLAEVRVRMPVSSQ